MSKFHTFKLTIDNKDDVEIGFWSEGIIDTLETFTHYLAMCGYDMEGKVLQLVDQFETEPKLQKD